MAGMASKCLYLSSSELLLMEPRLLHRMLQPVVLLNGF